MNYFLVVFTSRSETLDFAEKLNRNRVLANVISAPSGIGTSCNIAISVNANYYGKVLQIMQAQRYLTFSGYFKPQKMFGRAIRFVKLQT